MKKADKDLKLFIFALTIILSFISIKFASAHKNRLAEIVLSVALLLFAIGIFRPKIFKPIYYCWMLLAKAISALIVAFILIPIFYLVVVPIGIFLRLTGKDLLDLKLNTGDSYWHRKEETFSKESYLKQF